MKDFSFRTPFSRRQCAFLLLFATFSVWLFCLYSYFDLRQNSWQSVDAQIVELRGAASSPMKILRYEFQGRPYIAMLKTAQNGARGWMDFRIGSGITIFVHRSNPQLPKLDLGEISQLRIFRSIGIVIFSMLALYFTSRLIKTLESESLISQSIGDFDHLLEEFGNSSGWSDAFIELLERQHDPESATPTRASGGSSARGTGPTTIG